jgi:transcriptional regulator with XRE-family HTH domain
MLDEQTLDEQMLFKIIGRNVKYYRQLYNIGKTNKERITQEKLAEQIEVSTSLIGNLESEKTPQGIGVFTLWKISKALNIPIQALFTPLD